MSARRWFAPFAVTLALVGSGLGVSACSSDRPDAGKEYTLTFALEAGSGPVVLRDIGADKERRYGQAQLASTGELAGEPVDIELLCIINYLNGNGPFDGFWTFTAANGDQLVLEYHGRAEQRDGVGYLSGSMKVLGGTGQYVGVVGNGTAVGSRDGTFGAKSVINYTLTLSLDGLT